MPAAPAFRLPYGGLPSVLACLGLLSALTGCIGTAVSTVTGAGKPTSPAASPATSTGQSRAATSSATTPAAVNVYAHDGAGQLRGAARTAKALVYVPNTLSNTLQVIDPRTYQVIARYPTGHEPQHVVPSWDLKTLWVNDDLGNDLVPVNPRTGRPGRPVPVADPYNLYFTPDGAHALVMAERLHRIDVRDPHTMALQRSLPVPCDGLNHADYSADQSFFVASCEFSGKLLVIDRNATKIRTVINLNTIHTPGATTPTQAMHMGGPKAGLRPGASAMPQDVRLTPDGTRFLAADMLRNGVWVIDAHTLKVQRFLHTGKGTHSIYPDRTATRLFVANRDAGTITVLDAATLKTLHTWHAARRRLTRHGRRQRRRPHPVALRPLQQRRLRPGHHHRQAPARRSPSTTAPTACASGPNPAATASATPATCAEPSRATRPGRCSHSTGEEPTRFQRHAAQYPRAIWQRNTVARPRKRDPRLAVRWLVAIAVGVVRRRLRLRRPGSSGHGGAPVAPSAAPSPSAAQPSQPTQPSPRSADPGTSRDTARTTATLAFAGDVHFEGVAARALTQRWGSAGRVLADADLAIVNLETAVTRRGTPAPKQYTVPRPRQRLRRPPGSRCRRGDPRQQPRHGLRAPRPAGHAGHRRRTSHAAAGRRPQPAGSLRADASHRSRRTHRRPRSHRRARHVRTGRLGRRSGEARPGIQQGPRQAARRRASRGRTRRRGRGVPALGSRADHVPHRASAPAGGSCSPTRAPTWSSAATRTSPSRASGSDAPTSTTVWATSSSTRTPPATQRSGVLTVEVGADGVHSTRWQPATIRGGLPVLDVGQPKAQALRLRAHPHC